MLRLKLSTRRFAALGLFLGLLAAGRPCRAEEFYYVLIFGSQSHPKQLRYTHTWATFVRAVGHGSDASDYTAYAHTISWLPQTLDVRVWSLAPEPGVNLTLEQTLAAVSEKGEHVTMWGPFLTGPIVYERSLRVKQLLESGRVQYRAISTSAELFISDCIHAVAAVDPVFGRDHYPLIRIGKPASRFISRELMTRAPDNGINQELYDNSWLVPRLGLDRWPIEIVSPQSIPREPCFFCKLPP